MKTVFKSQKMLVALFLFLAWGTAVSEDWTGQGEVGYVLVSGNTDSNSLKAGINFEKSDEKWKHNAKLNAVKSENDRVVSSESYSAGWRSQYSFSNRGFRFGDFRYFDDKFDSFTEIYTASLGFGYKVIKNKTMIWDLSAGLGYRDTTIEVSNEDISGETYLLESDFKYTINQSTVLENNTRTEIAPDNTFIQNVAGLSVSINSSLALKLGYDLRYNSDPSPGFESMDRIFSTNIVYSF